MHHGPGLFLKCHPRGQIACARLGTQSPVFVRMQNSIMCEIFEDQAVHMNQ
ncbi:hypothetical protein CH72_4335 [Burkholderia ambifaria AMMD]|nr:hypothetical protein CH72_4335 [Burkholderia ambifaria AMMD]